MTALSVQAQTSLYIPGFDDQPLSASLIGVGSDDRTTWAIMSGAVTGTVDDAFDGTGQRMRMSIALVGLTLGKATP
ncbi:hypothetical protein NEOLEDRAFT_1130398 [Neolentinus lepideus HHB14362 ss-1]|uniref:Uncharacterized protein n=1 Tax=Neolentinus lepideus HHB14362 ss-1 TaxID=1314782 RepID=A0A165UB79_9AGAM|nr:hypothetical protein NEOLEDRAFT_1130398 [Neolentinus lepideus HHB14362 ss-1]